MPFNLGKFEKLRPCYPDIIPNLCGLSIRLRVFLAHANSRRRDPQKGRLIQYAGAGHFSQAEACARIGKNGFKFIECQSQLMKDSSLGIHFYLDNRERRGKQTCRETRTSLFSRRKELPSDDTVDRT